ncbi:MAG: PilZ domain-containing protein [Methylococcaceae bacterium]
MDLDEENIKKSNRRRAFRIYEQVNLFYHKIEYGQGVEATLGLNHDISNTTQSVENTPSLTNTASVTEDFLPESHSQENDTLNVNISSSGISFTCQKELMPGDYLMIRVLLLSRMTVITTSCKVVYCKPSNPFENNQYPYSVGAHFVNLKLDDKELLHRHVNKKRTRQFIGNGLLTSLILTVLVIPDLVFELLLGLSSFLLDNFVELVHLLYELIEYSLDNIVEHFFHTGLHETQVIVFYIQVGLGGVGLYVLLRIGFSVLQNLFLHSRVYLYRKKLSILYCWQQKSFLYKIGIISLGIIVFICYGLFFI